MLQGLSLATSGLMADEEWESVLSGDLANVDTPGFKSEMAILGSEGAQGLTDTAGGQGIGQTSVGAGLFETVPNLAEGTLQETGDPLNVALEGPGFMSVQTPQGIRYTRDGALSVDAGGELVTAGGNPVLGTGGRPIQAGPDAAIEANGQVTSGGRVVGQIALFAPALGQITDVGQGLFQARGAVPIDRTTRLVPGALEGSNVDAVQALSSLIQVQTQFDAGQNLVKDLSGTTATFIQAAG